MTLGYQIKVSLSSNLHSSYMGEDTQGCTFSPIQQIVQYEPKLSNLQLHANYKSDINNHHQSILHLKSRPKTNVHVTA